MPLRALVRLSHCPRAPPLELQSRRQAPIPALSCLLSAPPSAPEFLPCIPSAAPAAQAACSVPFRSHPPCDSASLTVDHAATVPPRACSDRSLPYDSGPPPDDHRSPPTAAITVACYRSTLLPQYPALTEPPRIRNFPRNQLPPSISHSPAAASCGRRAWGRHDSSLSWQTSAFPPLVLEEPWARQPVRSLAGTVPVSGAGTAAVARGNPVTGDSSSGAEGDSCGRGKRTSAGAAHEQRWRVPVLIVGAGPVGLTLSFLLSKLGVRSLVVERSQSLTHHPQAHLINNRTMEVFRHMDGLHDEIVRRQPPVHQWRAFVYCTGLLEGPLLGTVDHFQGQGHQPPAVALGDPLAASPTNVAHFSQHRLLPLLLQRALDAGTPLWHQTEDTAHHPKVPATGSSGGEQADWESSQGVARFQREEGDTGQAQVSSSHFWEAGTGPGTRTEASTAGAGTLGPGTPVLFGWQCTGVEACAEGVRVSISRTAPIAGSGPLGTSSTSSSIGMQQQQQQPGGRVKEVLEEEGSPGECVGSVVIESEYVVGCDGASSRLRGWAGVGMEGDPCLQRLVSVHFRSVSLGQRLLEMGRPGMLYFVFNTDVIAVFVAHSLEEGEFVAQIPYFPPGQEAQDFSQEECARLIRAALGSKAPDPPLPVEVISVRPWTMSAQVASSFLAPAPAPAPPGSTPLSQAGRGIQAGRGGVQPGRVILAGDAAHRFPPAGGFGMNTGIQDAHNLAWKLAAVLSSVSSPRLLATYHTERSEIAKANCALSVSNFYAAMGVATALGLDPRAPRVLQQALESFPVASLLPSSTRAALMQQALAAGRAQLSPWLLSAWNPLGAIRLQAARANLLDGRSLQLLFPEHDLGFRYRQGAVPQANSGGKGSEEGTREGEGQGPVEQWSPFRAVAGGRLPHHPFLAVDVQAGGPSAQAMAEAVISSHDLQSPPSLASTLIVSSSPASLASWLYELEPVVQNTRLPVRMAIVAASIGEVEAALKTMRLQLAPQHHTPRAEESQGLRDVAALAPETPLWQLAFRKSAKLHSEEGIQEANGSERGAESVQAVGRTNDKVQHRVAQRSFPLCFVLDAAGDRQPKHVWWQKIGVPPGGAVLVRPDGHIAWCSQGAEGPQQLLLALQEVYRP